jgi:hypothetical protein
MGITIVQGPRTDQREKPDRVMMEIFRRIRAVRESRWSESIVPPGCALAAGDRDRFDVYFVRFRYSHFGHTGQEFAAVNLLTFDYYIGTEQDMVTDTETAANGAFSEPQSLFPSESPARLWHMIGITEMPGIERDNGGCPGTKGAGTYSGLDQPTWYFSHVFEPFTR